MNNAKHRSQSNAREIAEVERFVHGIRDWKAIPHAVERQKERVFSERDVLDTLRVGDMIEVHANAPGRVPGGHPL